MLSTTEMPFDTKWMIRAGVVFLVRCAMKGIIQCFRSRKGRAHHLNKWKKGQRKPFTTQAYLPCSNS